MAHLLETVLVRRAPHSHDLVCHTLFEQKSYAVHLYLPFIQTNQSQLHAIFLYYSLDIMLVESIRVNMSEKKIEKEMFASWKKDWLNLSVESTALLKFTIQICIWEQDLIYLHNVSYLLAQYIIFSL